MRQVRGLKKSTPPQFHLGMIFFDFIGIKFTKTVYTKFGPDFCDGTHGECYSPVSPQLFLIWSVLNEKTLTWGTFCKSVSEKGKLHRLNL